MQVPTPDGVVPRGIGGGRHRTELAVAPIMPEIHGLRVHNLDDAGRRRCHRTVTGCHRAVTVVAGIRTPAAGPGASAVILADRTWRSKPPSLEK